MKKSASRTENHKTKKPHKPKHHLIRNAIGLGLLGTVTTATATVLGAWGAWQYVKVEADNRRRHTSDFNNVVTANTYHGRVHRANQNMTLTTATMTYHVVDPFAILDKLAKAHAETLKNDPSSHSTPLNGNDDFVVTVLAELSQKGRYGYLGHLDYQLTIVGVPD